MSPEEASRALLNGHTHESDEDYAMKWKVGLVRVYVCVRAMNPIYFSRKADSRSCQVTILMTMDPAAAADMLSHMDPGAAADILSHMDPDAAARNPISNPSTPPDSHLAMIIQDYGCHGVRGCCSDTRVHGFR